jgi:hypothetical protein
VKSADPPPGRSFLPPAPFLTPPWYHGDMSPTATAGPASTTPSGSVALSKKYKLRLPPLAWNALVDLAEAHRRSVNSEILTAIDTYIDRETRRK